MIWVSWIAVVCQLRSAFSRSKTYNWFVLILAGLTVRTDLMGVSSLVRALHLKGSTYQSLLDFFHSDAIDLRKLTRLWTNVCLRIFAGMTVKC